MKKLIIFKRILFLMFVTFILYSCATIVSTSKYPVSLNSNPSNAKVTVTNDKHVTVFEGTTPAMVTLKSGSGYFKPATYLIKFEKEGYISKNYSIHSDMDMWYIGNLLFGGLIGMLIVDPITGAMYKIEMDNIHAELDKSQINESNTEKVLQIYCLSEIPDHWKRYLVEIDYE